MRDLTSPQAFKDYQKFKSLLIESNEIIENQRARGNFFVCDDTFAMTVTIPSHPNGAKIVSYAEKHPASMAFCVFTTQEYEDAWGTPPELVRGWNLYAVNHVGDSIELIFLSGDSGFATSPKHEYLLKPFVLIPSELKAPNMEVRLWSGNFLVCGFGEKRQLPEVGVYNGERIFHVICAKRFDFKELDRLWCSKILSMAME